jgi:hypothetical protein
MKKWLFLGVLVPLFALCKNQSTLHKAPLEYVKAELAKFAPVELQVDLSLISENDKKVLAKLVDASRLIDELFLIQVDPENGKMLQSLQASASTENSAYLELFKVMFGPWDRLEHDKPFLGERDKPLGAGFYPPDMSKEEFERTKTESPDLAKALESEFTIITRQNGKLVPVPYYQAYSTYVMKISALLKEAAEITDDASLKKYLSLRADAFLTDDYFDSDMAWMDLSGDLEIVIGPYEVYEDNLYNYKAAYEAFLCTVDHDESQKLDKVSPYLNEMEANLPEPDEYKNFNRGQSSPIKVVNEVFAAGDTKAGIQTTAFNLPNDERVREAKGSKKVMLKNIASAKYEKCWIPIVNTVLADKPLKNVSFDSYFTHVLMHEMSHGLGPGNIVLNDGTKTTVTKELKELYSTIEECKADVLGIYNMKFLMDKGVFDKSQEYSMYASYLGGMLRSIRFGINEAHGGGVAIQWNYYFEKGAFYVNDSGKLTFDESKMFPAVTGLAHELLLIEARGDYDGANNLIQRYRQMTPQMKNAVEKLEHVPTDIRPIFSVVDQL